MGAHSGKDKKSARGHTQTTSKPTLTKASDAKSASHFARIADKFHTLEEVQEGLRSCGLESSNLIIGVDFTKSNTWNGKLTFEGKCLHQIEPDKVNPYQEVIWIMGRTLAPLDDDNLIPVYGFGDTTTKDKTVFPFFPDGRPANGFQEVLNRYSEIAPMVALSGPTSFAPLIKEAIQCVARGGGYHILLIIADGQVDNVKDTEQAIVEASNYPLSIIMVGVGDGPWELMEDFDDNLPKRKFDNFQFVPFYKTMERAENREVTFSIASLQEIPEQYLAIKSLGLL
eukprot:TRINITY_DN2009_c0_g1_i1.p1 TRINITY_DN2009_c0_g1~~TRINITY_DN2009_c0_g1_i1.p1  ORF type:complete len:284 (+),score=42.44 TRINITY_DN2009_c0_g1_i1:75-926(+)